MIHGEIEELTTQLEAAERARKAAEGELHEAADRWVPGGILSRTLLQTQSDCLFDSWPKEWIILPLNFVVQLFVLTSGIVTIQPQVCIKANLLFVDHRVTELSATNSNLNAAKRKLESDVQAMQSDLDDQTNELKAAEDHAKKAMTDATRLAEELRQEQVKNMSPTFSWLSWQWNNH